MNEIKISKLKLAWKFITGGKSGVIDYVLDVANNLAAKIFDARQDEIAKYLETAKKILSTLKSVEWLCPSKWRVAYDLTLTAFADLVNALADLKITRDEIDGMAKSFQLAYAEWRAD